MESPDRADQRSERDLVKNEAASGRVEEEPDCNGLMTDDEVKQLGSKRKAAFSDVENAGKRGGARVEEVRSEVPAHHARRPPNGFLLFCKRHRDIVSSKNPNLENRGVTKLLGNWWRTLEEDERDKYKELARQNKEIFIANNPQFTWYKLPAPPLRTLVTRPSNRRPPKLDPTPLTGAGPITPGKLADESQLGGLTSLLCSSLSPPTTPSNPSPPLPSDSNAPAPPKKRFLFQTRVNKHSIEKSLQCPTTPKNTNFHVVQKKYKKKKKNTSIKQRKMLKTEWKDSQPEKIHPENDRTWKTETNCTQQHLIEKIVESSFDAQKTFSDYDVQRTLDYINTEHTYQKNPDRFWQQTQQKNQKNEVNNESLLLETEIIGKEKVGGNGSNIIRSPNHNNNTIILSDHRPDEKNHLNYSFNDNNNLIVSYTDLKERPLNRHSIQTNHDRIRDFKNFVEGEGYIPGGKNACVRAGRQDCDTSTRSEDQKKPLIVAQVKRGLSPNVETRQRNCEGKAESEIGEESEAYRRFNDNEDDDDNNNDNDDGYDDDDDNDDDDDDEDGGGGGDGNGDEDGEDKDDEEMKKNQNDPPREIPKNCDNVNANFQSILGRVSREIISMMKDRDAQEAESMAVAKFNLRYKSDTDSEDGSWYDKSDESLPEFPEGRRSKRLCKGQRYEQFIKESVSKKRSKHGNSFLGIAENNGLENKSKRKKEDKGDLRVPEVEENRRPTSSERVIEFLSKERQYADATKAWALNDRMNGIPEEKTVPSHETHPKTNAEVKGKKQSEDEYERKNKEQKGPPKKRPLSKVQMIKEKKEIHVGEFNLNEKIEELPLLSFESFLQKKRQRKKRLLGMKKDGVRSKTMRNRIEKIRGKSPSKNSVSDSGKFAACTKSSDQSMPSSRPDFADLTTLAETALTLLSLREPR